MKTYTNKTTGQEYTVQQTNAGWAVIAQGYTRRIVQEHKTKRSAQKHARALISAD